MILSGIAIRSRSASVRDYRLKSAGRSMPSSDTPLFPNSKGVQFMKEIAVIVPSYNNRQWYERNLSSVVAQDYHYIPMRLRDWFAPVTVIALEACIFP
jgi:hypothetical protein